VSDATVPVRPHVYYDKTDGSTSGPPARPAAGSPQMIHACRFRPRESPTAHPPLHLPAWPTAFLGPARPARQARSRRLTLRPGPGNAIPRKHGVAVLYDTCYSVCMTEEPMPVDLHAEAFFTADHAVVESGKLYVNGGFWSRLNFPSFPVVHNFAVCVVLHIPWRAHNQLHAFAVSFEDADGQLTTNRLEGQFQTAKAADMRTGDYSVVPIAIGVNGFVLQRAGDYAAVLQVDRTEVSRWRFRAVQVVRAPGSAPGGAGSGPAAIPDPPTE